MLGQYTLRAGSGAAAKFSFTCLTQLEDKFSKKAIQMFTQSAGILDATAAAVLPTKVEPETVS